jgi:hypothetical protein
LIESNATSVGLIAAAPAFFVSAGAEEIAKLEGSASGGSELEDIRDRFEALSSTLSIAVRRELRRSPRHSIAGFALALVVRPPTPAVDRELLRGPNSSSSSSQTSSSGSEAYL